MAPSKKSSSNHSGQKKSPPPKSAFHAGKFKGSPSGLFGSSKDKRNQLIVEGLQQGVVVMYMKKYNRNEEAFLAPDIHYLQENQEEMDKLGINAIVARRGTDGKTPMPQKPDSSTPNKPNKAFYWKQFIVILGEDNNTAENRAQVAKQLVNRLNNNELTAAEYTYPNKSKFLKDCTASPPRALDACLLDCDVLALMKAAYPDMDLKQLVTDYPEIIASFWSDKAIGTQVIDNDMDDNGLQTDSSADH